jgi:hypothetical protein
LKLDHGADVRVEVRQGSLHDLVRDGSDLIGLGRGGPSLLQPGDGLEPLVDSRGDEFFTHAPLEQTLDAAHPLVDQPAAESPIDHLLANGF